MKTIKPSVKTWFIVNDSYAAAVNPGCELITPSDAKILQFTDEAQAKTACAALGVKFVQ